MISTFPHADPLPENQEVGEPEKPGNFKAKLTSKPSGLSVIGV
jgi:hypothetical protein